MSVPTNFLAVIAAAIVNYVTGAIWFGVLFRKAWTKLSGSGEMKVSTLSIILGLIGAFLTAYVLHHALFFANEFLKTSGVGGGLMVGFFNWLGFIAPVTIGIVTYEKKPFTLWILNNAYWLISLLVMGIILSVWQ